VYTATSADIYRRTAPSSRQYRGQRLFLKASANNKVESGTLCAILSLPTDLRLRIYEFVITEIPLCVHRTVSSGLIYACKQTQYEIEPIILAAMNTDLTRIEEICLRHFAVEIVFEALSNLHAFENIHITARSEWQPLDPTMRTRNPLLPLT
jgi:hypothetical protein